MSFCVVISQTVADRLEGRHFLILYTCAHVVSFPGQIPRSLVWERDQCTTKSRVDHAVESPAYRKSIRSHTKLFSAHRQTRPFNMTFDSSSRIPKNRYISGNARAILMELISELCGKQYTLAQVHARAQFYAEVTAVCGTSSTVCATQGHFQLPEETAKTLT